MCSTSTTDDGGFNPITALHPDIIQSHILNRLDGPTLASTTCASAQLLSLCSDDHLWRRICNSTWPSTTHPTVRSAISNFPSGHRSFYTNSFPTVRCCSISGHVPHTSELISAVDVHYNGELIYSKVLSTETISSWFLGSLFHLDLLETKETVATPLKFDGEGDACVELAKERLRVSWILIDPSKRRAIKVTSVTAVDARRQWLTEDIQLRYATVVSGGDGNMVQLAVMMTLGGMEGAELQLREICMQVEDVEGRSLTGEDSLKILDGAMEGQRCKITCEVEKEMYEMFLKRKEELKEIRQQRERDFDMVCLATAVSIFISIWILFLSS